LAEKMTVRF